MLDKQHAGFLLIPLLRVRAEWGFDGARQGEGRRGILLAQAEHGILMFTVEKPNKSDSSNSCKQLEKELMVDRTR